MGVLEPDAAGDLRAEEHDEPPEDKTSFDGVFGTLRDSASFASGLDTRYFNSDASDPSWSKVKTRQTKPWAPRVRR